jgi:hypothetical protein
MDGRLFDLDLRQLAEAADCSAVHAGPAALRDSGLGGIAALGRSSTKLPDSKTARART